MEVAENESVMMTDVGFLFQAINNVIHGRRAHMQHFRQASGRSAPALLTQLFRIGQTIDIREYRDVGKGQPQLLQHPTLYRKIKTLCHDRFQICCKGTTNFWNVQGLLQKNNTGLVI